MFVVILAQSAATSRAYATKYEEPFSEATDLVGLGAANAAAAFSGTFVVNGSPTKAQIVDTAGGRSQLSSLTASAVVLIDLELLTGPLGIGAGRLHATVFGGDEQAGPDTQSLETWADLGVPAEPSTLDNWWSNGPVGLCGPDSEMFAWTGDGRPQGFPWLAAGGLA